MSDSCTILIIIVIWICCCLCRLYVKTPYRYRSEVYVVLKQKWGSNAWKKLVGGFVWHLKLNQSTYVGNITFLEKKWRRTLSLPIYIPLHFFCGLIFAETALNILVCRILELSLKHLLLMCLYRRWPSFIIRWQMRRRYSTDCVRNGFDHPVVSCSETCTSVGYIGVVRFVRYCQSDELLSV